MGGVAVVVDVGVGGGRNPSSTNIATTTSVYPSPYIAWTERSPMNMTTMRVEENRKPPIKNRLKHPRRRRGFFIGLVISSILSQLCSFRMEDGYSEGVLGARLYACQKMNLGINDQETRCPDSCFTVE